MLRTFVVLVLLSMPGAVALAAAPEPPREKPAEVSTVGTAPAVLTAADQAKLLEVVRRVALRDLEASAARGFALPTDGFVALGKRPDFETRTPSVGERDRTKPVEAVPAAPAPGGRP